MHISKPLAYQLRAASKLPAKMPRRLPALAVFSRSSMMVSVRRGLLNWAKIPMSMDRSPGPMKNMSMKSLWTISSMCSTAWTVSSCTTMLVVRLMSWSVASWMMLSP